MWRSVSGWVAILLAAATLVLPGVAGAQIYKWTDEHGNVHFGDKPMDQDTAQKAETVVVEEAYKPPARSEQEIRALQEKQRARAEADRRRREANEARLAEEKAENDQRKAQMCAAIDEDIEKLGTAKMVDGILTVHYLSGEDGKSISSAEQRRVVEELKAKREALGCP